ncbi:alpha/beta hydrolase [Candidatus Parcubacteria bacterium]|nr:alpha/beta hydrolase [Candidatus Parcubacteria bacterium]
MKNLLLVVINLFICLFFISSVNAAVVTDKFYTTSSSDGTINSTSGSWNIRHDAVSGIVHSNVGHFVRAECFTTDYCIIYRGGVAFDTSSIPDNAIIQDASINLFIIGVKDDYSDDILSSAVIVQGVGETLESEDFNDFGTVNNPEEWSGRFKWGDYSVGEYNAIALNTTGISGISTSGWSSFGMRTGYDVDDIRPETPGGVWMGFRFDINYYEDDINKAPYLEVTYTIPDEPETTDPLILIPGIGGSWEKDGVMMLDPILHTYKYLTEALTNNGYALNENLFLFPYDWRQSNNETAIDLKNYINYIKATTSQEQVDIVAHSMGGLVARSYVQGAEYDNDVDQLIFLNTPHIGSTDSYLINEGGYFSGIKGNILKYILNKEAKKKEKNLINYIRDDITSVSELLPTYDYLMDKDGNDWQTRVYPANYPVNSFIDDLNENIEVVATRAEATNIYSDPITDSTLRYLHVVPDTYIYDNKWKYGYPDCIFLGDDDCLIMGEGDTTVLTNSLIALPGASTTTISDSKHRDIVTKSQKEVIKILTGSNTDDYYEASWKDIKDVLLVRAMCPVDFVVITPEEKRVGKDFVSGAEVGAEVNEVEGAFYTGPDGLHEFSTIINPAPGPYRVILQGTADGVYQLGIDILTDDTFSGPNDDLISGVTCLGDVHEYQFTINDSNEIIDLTRTRELNFSAVRDDIECLFVSGDIKKLLIKNWLIKNIDHLEKKYDQWENSTNEKLKTAIKKYINLHIWLIEKQIKFYNNKNWITDEAYEILSFDLKSLQQSIWQ